MTDRSLSFSPRIWCESKSGGILEFGEPTVADETSGAKFPFTSTMSFASAPLFESVRLAPAYVSTPSYPKIGSWCDLYSEQGVTCG